MSIMVCFTYWISLVFKFNFRILVNIVQSCSALSFWYFVIWHPIERRKIQNDVVHWKNWSGKKQKEASRNKDQLLYLGEKRNLFIGVSKGLIFIKVNLCWTTPGRWVKWGLGGGYMWGRNASLFPFHWLFWSLIDLHLFSNYQFTPIFTFINVYHVHIK